MQTVKHHLTAFHKDESGQNLIEYALVAALIALACVTTLGTLGNTIGSAFTTVGSKLTSAM